MYKVLSDTELNIWLAIRCQTPNDNALPQSCPASGGTLSDGGPRKAWAALPAADGDVAAALAALDGREVGGGPSFTTGLAYCVLIMRETVSYCST